MHLISALVLYISVSSLSSALIVKSSDGTEIFATAEGNPLKPSIVFVHGFALSGVVFDDLFENRLLADFYLVSYDLRGHGRSGSPTSADSYSSQLFADDFDVVSKAFNLTSPVLVGWSYGASVASDIFTYLQPGAISGLISAAGIPYLGLTDVNTPLSLAYLPGLLSTDDVVVYANSKISFVNSLYADPAAVPVEVKWAWLGATALQLPTIAQLLVARAQSAAKLYLAGSTGFPLMLLYGTADAVLQDDVITSQIAPHFINVEVYKIEGGSHAMFYDNTTEFIRAVVGFARRISTRELTNVGE